MRWRRAGRLLLEAGHGAQDVLLEPLLGGHEVHDPLGRGELNARVRQRLADQREADGVVVAGDAIHVDHQEHVIGAVVGEPEEPAQRRALPGIDLAGEAVILLVVGDVPALGGGVDDQGFALAGDGALLFLGVGGDAAVDGAAEGLGHGVSPGSRERRRLYQCKWYASGRVSRGRAQKSGDHYISECECPVCESADHSWESYGWGLGRCQGETAPVRGAAPPRPSRSSTPERQPQTCGLGQVCLHDVESIVSRIAQGQQPLR